MCLFSVSHELGIALLHPDCWLKIRVSSKKFRHAMAYRRRLKNKKTPEGWQLIEEVIEDFEAQMKEAVNEEHEGKRKNELTWKITRIHWEKNRFIYDLMYKRKVMSRELVRTPIRAINIVLLRLCIIYRVPPPLVQPEGRQQA